MVPHLIGSILICPPIHKSKTTLFELIGPPFHWSPFSLIHPISANPNGPPSHWSPISLVPQLAPTPPPPTPLVPHIIGPFSPAGAPIHKSPPNRLNSLVLHLIGPRMLPFLPCSYWSPISLEPHCNPFYPVLIGPPSHWSPNITLSTLFSLIPHLIGPPIQPWLYSSHWYPISLVPQCNPGYTVLIGPPSHWSPSLTISTLFSLVPHLIDPPMRPWLHSSHWSPISLVPQCDPDYTVLIGPPSHWYPIVTLSTLFSLVPHLVSSTMLPFPPCSHRSPISLVPPIRHWLHKVLIGSPISLVPQCNPGYTALIGPPSHWLPLVTFPTLLSLVPHLIGLISGPKGSVLSTPQILPKYWTHRWRIDINISHGITPIEPS